MAGNKYQNLYLMGYWGQKGSCEHGELTWCQACLDNIDTDEMRKIKAILDVKRSRLSQLIEGAKSGVQGKDMRTDT